MSVSRQSLGSSSPSQADKGDLRAAPHAADASALTGELELSRARYTFTSEANPEADWQLAHMTMREEVSTSYQVVAQLVSPEGEDATPMLGRSCTLTIERDDCRRYVHGIVTRLRSTPMSGCGTAVDLTFVPALQALAQRIDSRIFQDKTVPEVLDLVLGPALSPYGRRHESRLRRTSYPRREYVVQYRETDLAFVLRLMGEEGIWFYFEHEPVRGAGHAELLVWVDANEEATSAALGHAGDELPMQLEAGAKAQWQSVSQFQVEHQLAPTSVAVREYNWTNPAAIETRSVPRDDPGVRAIYEPHGLTFSDFSHLRYQGFDTHEQARLRWECHGSEAERAIGVGNVVGLMPGQSVVVRGQSTALDGEWIVLAVEASGRDAKNLEQAAEQLEDYANTFTCIRRQHPYRSRRREKPRVSGIQTATVVGPSGRPEVAAGEDDIHTDEHGRVCVKLSWDRTDPRLPEATVTCFVRVTQAWGGNGWGFMFIPRIGMEVVVSFVDGDPDRPLVTGCVYNGLNRPSHPLPRDKTKSYIKTQSSPSGKGSNELQFDDADGQEQVYLHAQRDHNQVVGRNQTTKVRASQALEIGVDRSEVVGGAEHVTVHKTRAHTVHGDDTLRVLDGSARRVELSGSELKQVAKRRELEVTELSKETLSGGRETTIKRADVLRVVDGANKNVHVTGQYNIEADEHFTVQQGRGQLYMKDNFFVSSVGDVQLKNGGFHLHAQQDGKTTLQVDRELIIKVGRSTLRMQADGTIEISGPTKTQLVAQGGTLEASVQGASVTGQKTTISATALTEITGPMVKIN